MTDRENSGALFINKRKKEAKHPDLTGPCKITCLHCGAENELEQSAWTKTDSNGATYHSQSFRQPRQPG